MHHFFKDHLLLSVVFHGVTVSLENKPCVITYDKGSERAWKQEQGAV